MNVAALAGGVGGAKLLVGLDAALGERGELTAIVNTADDAEIYGVHVSPDVDIVTYWLAGIADRARGWGIAGDTFGVVDALADLGEESWFRLGDRDFATCITRTFLLRGGASLTEATTLITRRLGVDPKVVPMSDDPVRTRIHTPDGRSLDFQEWFVRDRCSPGVARVELVGIEAASPAPGVIDAIARADVVVVCPSNPIVSIGPILSLPGVRAALRAHPRVVAVTPIVRGVPIKGPADILLRASGTDVSASAVAALYSDFCDVFVVDSSDPEEKAAVAGPRPFSTDTMMVDAAASERLARAILEATALSTVP